MFRWYELSAQCYAYPEDVSWCPSDPIHPTEMHLTKTEMTRQILGNSRWFTRGWTLQELIAPFQVFFYNTTWSFLGTRTTLKRYIAEITSIDKDVFSAPRSRVMTDPDSIRSLLASKSVAQRMSWAASRRTTREEDITYCLMGLFDIYMPLLYGEGNEKAFLRLQLEIMRDSADQSLLAWDLKPNSSVGNRVFASHPKDFVNCRTLATIPKYEISFETTNKGLNIRLRLLERSHGKFAGVLACYDRDDFLKFIAIPLTKDIFAESSPTSQQELQDFARDISMPIQKIPIQAAAEKYAPWRTIRLPTKYKIDIAPNAPTHFVFKSKLLSSRKYSCRVDALPAERWDPSLYTMQFRDTRYAKRHGALAITSSRFSPFGVVFGAHEELYNELTRYVRFFEGPRAVFQDLGENTAVDAWLQHIGENTVVEAWLQHIILEASKFGKLRQIYDRMDMCGRSLTVNIKSKRLLGKPVYVVTLDFEAFTEPSDTK